MKKVVIAILCLLPLLAVLFFAINIAPADLAAATDEDTSLLLPLRKPLFGKDFTLSENPTHGSCEKTAAGWEYTPARDFNGTDQITFAHPKAKDGRVAVTVTVNPVQDTPITTSLSVTLEHGEKATLPPLAKDVDGDTLTYSIKTQPALGEIKEIRPGGLWSISYTALKPGEDVVEYAVSDGTTEVTGVITVTITPSENPKVPLDKVSMRLPLWNYVSPMHVGGEMVVENRRVTLEGTDGTALGKIVRFDSLRWILANSDPTRPAGLTLNPTEPIPVRIVERDVSGEAIVTRDRRVNWRELAYLDPPMALTVRRGDSVLCKRMASEHSTVRLYAVDTTPETSKSVSGTLGEPLIWTFKDPGKYWLERLENGSIRCKAKINVVGISGAKPSYYVQCGPIKKSHKIEAPLVLLNLAADAIQTESAGLDLRVLGGNGADDSRLLLEARVTGSKDLAMCTRLGIEGPVLWYAPLKTFELDTTGKRYIGVIDETDTHLVSQLTLMVRPVYPELTYQLRTLKVHHYPMNKSNLYEIPHDKFVLNKKTGWYEYVYRIYYAKNKRSTMHEANVFHNGHKVGGY